jgi:hypothetical protein
MRPSEEVPIEIWELIIYCTLLDTLLLSTAPMDYSWRFTDAMEDWMCRPYSIDGIKLGFWSHSTAPVVREFKQTRTRLQLVCRAWKWCADSPRLDALCIRTNRFKTYNDPPTTSDIRSAKRLEAIHPERDPYAKLEQTLGQVFEEKRGLAAEILIDIGGTVTNRILKHNSQLFPHLTALHLDLYGCAGDPSPTLNLEHVLPKLPFLTCLSLQVENKFSFSRNTLHLPNLTGLSIIGRDQLPQLWTKSWYLPSLRHLQIVGLNRTHMEHDVLIHLFSLSPHLRTLCLRPPRRNRLSFQLPLETLWDKCPQLIYLQAPLSNIWQSKMPTEQRPLRHLVNTDPLPIAYNILAAARSSGVARWYDLVPEFCSIARDLRTITDSHSWTESGHDSFAAIMALRLEKLHIRYEDKTNRSLKECQDNFFLSERRTK